MKESTPSRRYFVECTKDIMDIWSMSEKEFAEWIGFAKNTMNDYLKKDYRWKKWTPERVKILILSVGESVNTSDKFNEKIMELGTKNAEEINSEQGLKDEKKSIERFFSSYYKRNLVENCAKELQNLIEKTYKAVEKKDIKRTDEQKQKIESWMREKFPTVARRCGLIEDEENNNVKSETTDDEKEFGEPKPEDDEEPSSPSETETTDDEKPISLSEYQTTNNEENTINIKFEDTELSTLENISEKEISIIIANGNTFMEKAEKEYKKAKKIKRLTKLKKYEELQSYIKHLEGASKFGYVKAIYKLGMVYKYDSRTEKDRSKAVECFFQAGNMKMDAALYELADCYQNGIGIEKSAVKAALLIDILKNIGYQPKKIVDIRLTKDSKRKKKFEIEYQKFLIDFSPETEEEQKLEKLCKLWKNN